MRWNQVQIQCGETKDERYIKYSAIQDTAQESEATGSETQL